MYDLLVEYLFIGLACILHTLYVKKFVITELNTFLYQRKYNRIFSVLQTVLIHRALDYSAHSYLEMHL